MALVCSTIAHEFCVNKQGHVPYDRRTDFNDCSQTWPFVFASANAHLSDTLCIGTCLWVPYARNNWDTIAYIYKSFFFFTRSSGVDEGDLPHCLETGIGNLITKAITEPKSREILFGTTLWHHVQIYCYQYFLLMETRSTGQFSWRVLKCTKVVAVYMRKYPRKETSSWLQLSVVAVSRTCESFAVR